MPFPEFEYAQNIIISIIFRNTFAWYITDKEYWYLDYTKYDRALLESGFKDPTVGDYSSRFDIAVLDTDTIEHFLSHIVARRVSSEALSYMLLARKKSNKEEDLLDFAPCLLVDFDQKQLFSQYPEMIRFEIYVPNGWLGAYHDFTLKIPENARYWIIDGHNVFNK